MKLIKLGMLFVAAAVFTPFVSNAQYRVAGDGDPLTEYRVELVDSRPDLAIDFAKVGQLKLFIRKSEYRLDEILLVDIAVLARHNHEIYVPVNMDATFHAKDRAGNKIILKAFYSADSTPAFLRSKDALIFSNYKFLVGCSSGHKLMKSPTENESIFERNGFQTTLEGCVDLRSGGEIEIWAELFNRRVAIPRSGDAPQTAVGRIRSNSLLLTIK